MSIKKCAALTQKIVYPQNIRSILMVFFNQSINKQTSTIFFPMFLDHTRRHCVYPHQWWFLSWASEMSGTLAFPRYQPGSQHPNHQTHTTPKPLTSGTHRGQGSWPPGRPCDLQTAPHWWRIWLEYHGQGGRRVCRWCRAGLGVRTSGSEITAGVYDEVQFI